MPPRGTRGARGGRSARGGSGRGGGGAAAVAAASASASGPLPVDDRSSQDGGRPASAPGGGDGAVTPEVISVRSTPSVQETAAPPPRQSATPGAPSSLSRGGGGGGTRFKPKNIRRDASERQRLEEERNRDLASKIKQEEREQRAEERRARRGRGRGGAMSQRGFIRRTVTATGPFSGVPLENVKSGKGGGGGGGWGSRLTDIPYVGSARYRPRREHETRVNIDVLSGFAEDVEDPEAHFQTFRSGQKSGSLPMGLFRTEHQEEEVKVATTAELEAEEQQSEDDGDLFVADPLLPAKDARGADDVDMTDDDDDDDNEVWHAAPPGTAKVKVKTEPGTGDDATDVDMSEIPEVAAAATTGAKAPPSPELRKTKKASSSSAADGVLTKQRERRRERALQDPEVQHTVLDLQAMLQELRLYREGDEQSGQNKDGRLYLFQLPPILPPLRPEERPSGGGEDGGGGGGVAGVQAAPPKIKKEDGTEAPSASASASASSSSPFSALAPGGGRIGRLNVRRSGRVELDWGGTTLGVGMGAETEFLTSAVMLETREHPDNPEALTGVGYGMGQVMGKFVLTPVWDDEGDWEPSLDDYYNGGGLGGEEAG